MRPAPERTDSAATLSAHLGDVRDHFERFLHDEAMSTAPVGSRQWFADLERYRYEKLPFLRRFLELDACAGCDVLDVGCGVGLDLAQFARAGARAVGIDLAPKAVRLAQLHLEQQGLAGSAMVMSGEDLRFTDESFDLVYSHAALPYAEHPERFVCELHRVLRPGGAAVVMLYHENSWINALSRWTGVPLEHHAAPHHREFTREQVRGLMRAFADVRIVTERFPVPTRLFHGWKATAYNRLFVPAFNAVPRALTRRWGAHLMVRAVR